MNPTDAQLVSNSIQFLLSSFVNRLNQESAPPIEEFAHRVAKRDLFENVDECLFGSLRYGELAVVSGPDQDLVHDLVFSTAIDLACALKNPVVLISPAQSHFQILLKLLANQSHISKAKLVEGDIKRSEWGCLVSALNNLQKCELFVFNDEIGEIVELIKLLRHLNGLCGIGAVFVDCVDSLLPKLESSCFPRSVLSHMRSLSELTCEIGVPIVAGMPPYLDYRDKDLGLSKLDCIDPSGKVLEIADQLFLAHCSENNSSSLGKNDVEVIRIYSDSDPDIPTRSFLDYQSLSGSVTAKPFPID
ncbi:DnaB-like helicase C-terminal domain-containing protein [Pseudomonadota bacterium]